MRRRLFVLANSCDLLSIQNLSLGNLSQFASVQIACRETGGEIFALSFHLIIGNVRELRRKRVRVPRRSRTDPQVVYDI